MPETPSPALFDDSDTGSAAAALARHARFLEANLAAIPDFVYALDRQRRFTYANPAMLALFGLSADEMLGKNFADLDYPPSLADLLNSHIDRVVRERCDGEGRGFLPQPEGTGGLLRLSVGTGSGRRRFRRAGRGRVARR